jgi:hypothetical protein
MNRLEPNSNSTLTIFFPKLLFSQIIVSCFKLILLLAVIAKSKLQLTKPCFYNNAIIVALLHDSSRL